jgi:hypothetical protein
MSASFHFDSHSAFHSSDDWEIHADHISHVTIRDGDQICLYRDVTGTENEILHQAFLVPHQVITDDQLVGLSRILSKVFVFHLAQINSRAFNAGFSIRVAKRSDSLRRMVGIFGNFGKCPALPPYAVHIKLKFAGEWK